VRQL